MEGQCERAISEPELLDDEDPQLEEGSLAAMAVKKGPLVWRTFPEEQRHNDWPPIHTTALEARSLRAAVSPRPPPSTMCIPTVRGLPGHAAVFFFFNPESEKNSSQSTGSRMSPYTVRSRHLCSSTHDPRCPAQSYRSPIVCGILCAWRVFPFLPTMVN
jgi:hypothetical protein